MINFLTMGSDIANIPELSLEEEIELIDTIMTFSTQSRIPYLQLIKLELLKFVKPNDCVFLDVKDNSIFLNVMHDKLIFKGKCSIERNKLDYTAITSLSKWIRVMSFDTRLYIDVQSDTYTGGSMSVKIPLNSDKKPNILFRLSTTIRPNTKKYQHCLTEMHRVISTINIHPEIQKVLDLIERVREL